MYSFTLSSCKPYPHLRIFFLSNFNVINLSLEWTMNQLLSGWRVSLLFLNYLDICSSFALDSTASLDTPLLRPCETTFLWVISYRSKFESYWNVTSRVYQKYLQVSNLRKLPKLNEFNSRVRKMVIKLVIFDYSKNDEFQ